MSAALKLAVEALRSLIAQCQTRSDGEGLTTHEHGELYHARRALAALEAEMADQELRGPFESSREAEIAEPQKGDADENDRRDAAGLRTRSDTPSLNDSPPRLGTGSSQSMGRADDAREKAEKIVSEFLGHYGNVDVFVSRQKLTTAIAAALAAERGPGWQTMDEHAKTLGVVWLDCGYGVLHLGKWSPPSEDIDAGYWMTLGYVEHNKLALTVGNLPPVRYLPLPPLPSPPEGGDK